MKRSNIEVQRDMNDFVMFKTTCECCSSDHTMTVVVEKWGSDDSLPMVSIYYKCACIDFGASGSFFEADKTASFTQSMSSLPGIVL